MAVKTLTAAGAHASVGDADLLPAGKDGNAGTHRADVLRAYVEATGNLRKQYAGPTAPVSPAPVDGQTFFNSTSLKPYQRRGGAWVERWDTAPAETIAGLLSRDAAATVGDGTVVVVLGYHSLGDCSAIFFRWNAASSDAHDGFGVLRPSVGAASTGNGRWIRVDFSRVFNVAECGAKGDGVAIDTAAIKKAVAKAKEQSGLSQGGAVVYFPAPTDRYLVDEKILIDGHNIQLVGDAAAATMISRAANDFGPTFEFTTGTTTALFGCGMRNLWVVGNSSMSVATSIAHVVADNVNHFDVANVTISEGAGGIELRAAASVNIRGYRAAFSTGAAAGRAALRCNPSAIAGLTHKHPGDVFVSDFNFLCGTGTLVSKNADYGIDVKCVDGLWLSNGHIIASAEANIRLHRDDAGNQLTNVFSRNVMLDMTGGNALLIDGPEMCEVADLEFVASAAGFGTAGKDGVLVTGPTRNYRVGAIVRGWKGAGVTWTGASIGLHLYLPIVEDNDTDNSGGTWQIKIDNATRGTAILGTIGGDGRCTPGVLVGAGNTDLRINGGRVGDCSVGMAIAAGFAGKLVVEGTDLSGCATPLQDLSTPGAATIRFFGVDGVTKYFWDHVNSRFGIRTAAPSATLCVSENATAPAAPIAGTVAHILGADGANTRLTVDAFNANPFISLRRADGTNASKSAVVTDTPIGLFSCHGYGATAFGGGVASLVGYAAENFTDTAQGTYWSFRTTAIGSIAAVENVRIGPDGSVSIRQNAQVLWGADGVFRDRVLTVATLPASPVQGMRAIVTDANSTTFLATVAGGGANKVPVFYDGSAWKIG